MKDNAEKELAEFQVTVESWNRHGGCVVRIPHHALTQPLPQWRGFRTTLPKISATQRPVALEFK